MSRDLKGSVKVYFEEFGEAVGEAVYRELIKSGGGLPRLLRKLGIPADGTSEMQYASLVQYFRRVGTKDFLQLTGFEKLDFRIEVVSKHDKEGTSFSKQLAVMPVDRSSAQLRPAGEAVDLSGTGPRARGPADSQATANRVAGQDARQALPNEQMARADSSPGVQLPKAPPPAFGTYDRTTPSHDPAKPYNPMGEWPATERRTGEERRKSRERRSSVDMVYKNRRFGRDRRSGIERRKNWPPGGTKK